MSAEHEDDKSRFRNLAVHRLGVREYSAAELQAYLKKKGADDRIAAEIVSDLARAGYVSDERYATMVVRHQALRGKGPRYIQSKLKQKGVSLDPDRIRSMAEESTGKSSLEAAREILERRYPSWRSDQKEANRAYQALLRRGFSFDVARSAVFQFSSDEEN